MCPKFCSSYLSDPYAYALKPDKEVKMSTTTTETTADATSGDNNVETSEATITTTATTTTTNNKQADNKSMKKVRSKKGVRKHVYFLIKVHDVVVCSGFNVTFNNFSVIPRQCLVATGS